MTMLMIRYWEQVLSMVGDPGANRVGRCEKFHDSTQKSTCNLKFTNYSFLEFHLIFFGPQLTMQFNFETTDNETIDKQELPYILFLLSVVVSIEKD